MISPPFSDWIESRESFDFSVTSSTLNFSPNSSSESVQAFFICCSLELFTSVGFSGDGLKFFQSEQLARLAVLPSLLVTLMSQDFWDLKSSKLSFSRPVLLEITDSKLSDESVDLLNVDEDDKAFLPVK